VNTTLPSWRLWILLFNPGVSRAELPQGTQTKCYKLAPQPAAPETQGWKNVSHSRDVTLYHDYLAVFRKRADGDDIFAW